MKEEKHLYIGVIIPTGPKNLNERLSEKEIRKLEKEYLEEYWKIRNDINQQPRLTETTIYYETKN